MKAARNLHQPIGLATNWRHRLHQEQATLRQAFENKYDTAGLLRQHSRLVDALLRDLWRESALPRNLCLVAVGGYGRGELFPYSDVDLLILLSDYHNDTVDTRIEALIGLFWDIGLTVGHSVRSISECINEAARDVTVQTNLLESRLITGDTALYRRFGDALAANMDVHTFFKAKTHEQDQRHARFNDTAYNLEPNIKESPGGLRDLQTILWITRSLGLGDNWNALAKHNLITFREARQIRRHELALQGLRIRLHYLANRREDRLLFDFQNDLAKHLGYLSSDRRRASEKLMHGYYRTAKFVGLMNEILLQTLREHIYPEQHDIVQINARFEAHNALLDAKSSTLLQRHPSSILEIFLLLQLHSELTGMCANLLRTLQRARNLLNREFRQNPENKRLFLQILRHPSDVTKTLRLMSHYGILGRYIPAFGRITGQMQHDLFHVYTVDEHILNVLCNLRRFVSPEYAHEFPLCSKLFAGFDAPHLLYLGALFHDIAKGRGGDHSILGTVDAHRFCKSHGLPKADGELVAWLVQSHLSMSSTAQKSDLSDPAVIESFARMVGDERHLTALYLLTVADIRGTSPKVWNAWKAKLLENLFLITRRLFTGAVTNADTELLLRQQQANKTLNLYGVAEKDYRPLWNKLGRPYFLRHESQEIAWHTRLLLSHLNSETPIVRTRLSPDGGGIQVMIYNRDRDDLFARICGFFERAGYNIVEAKIHTTLHGYALDSFLVLDQSDKSVRYRDLLSYIEHEITLRLGSNSKLESPLEGRISRQVKHLPIKPVVSMEAEIESNRHLLNIVAGDRPGLLSHIAHTYLQHDVHLHMAKINTLGNRAEDTFLISGRDGKKLTEDNLKALEEGLLGQL